MYFFDGEKGILRDSWERWRLCLYPSCAGKDAPGWGQQSFAGQYDLQGTQRKTKQIKACWRCWYLN